MALLKFNGLHIWDNREHRTGCSNRPSSKAAASGEARRTLRYVEPLREVRTPLADFFSILLGIGSGSRQACLLRKAQHEVHGLDGLACGTLH
jgi:hypothetical protein